MRDPQTVPAATFDHFDFFFFRWFGLPFWGFLKFFFFIIFFILASVSLGTEKGKKKKLYRLTGMGSQIVWKILSDGNWVMMPNGCEKLSDEWWVMSDKWRVTSDGNWVIKKMKPNSPLNSHSANFCAKVRVTK